MNSLTDAEAAEDVVEDVVCPGFPQHAAEFSQGFSQADCGDFISQIGGC